jgi:hypothetical protein
MLAPPSAFVQASRPAAAADAGPTTLLVLASGPRRTLPPPLAPVLVSRSELVVGANPTINGMQAGCSVVAGTAIVA